MPDHADHLARYLDELTAGGDLTDPAWRDAFARVPRHLFLPAFFRSEPDGRWQAIDATHPDYWSAVYSDTTLTTQLDGDTDPDPTAGTVSGTGTSSSTQPSLMAFMLDALRITGDERVLEIGTGTGYNAALLSHRLGAHHVTTVEVDGAVCDRARRHLTAAGHQPTVVTGDGALGWPAAAPYDRLIATVAVPSVPAAWIEQIRDGGVIVTSLWRDLGGGPLVRLDIQGDTAQGFFLPQPGGFMPVRSAETTPAALSRAVKQTGQTRTTDVPSSMLHHPDAGLWLALRLPGVTWLGFTQDGGHDQTWLFAPDGSWAMVDDTDARTEQYGPRNLWDEAENIYQAWDAAGRPPRDRLGVTVTRAGMHRFWLDQPETAQW